MADALLDIKNLYVQYQTDEDIVNAVNGINLTIGRGETVGLVGETGAGKTTTALSILKLLQTGVGKVTDGEIVFDGKEILDMDEEEMKQIRGRKISMIFQDPMTSLNPVLTVGDQIGEAIYLHKKTNNSDLQKSVDSIMELVGIPASRKVEYPHQFSGGMKQRVIIAMALACRPELLIADEPTTALDVTVQAQVLDMMNDLKKQLGTSMILITHDLGIVALMCDNVAIMYAGEIIEYGTVEDIYDKKRPHHPYTIGLFGAIPSLTEECERLTPVDGLMPDPVNLPSGCKFHTRCEHCTEKCVSEVPGQLVNGTHMIKCHSYN
jgi:peptide/nickel transport system ATP-binding protein